MSDTQYNDDDFVYVDPDTKTVVGIVEWDKNGNAIPKEWPRVASSDASDDTQEKGKGKARRKPKKRFYPWGSHKTLSKVYRIEKTGKDKDTEEYIPLDDAVNRLQKEPYWD